MLTYRLNLQLPPHLCSKQEICQHCLHSLRPFLANLGRPSHETVNSGRLGKLCQQSLCPWESSQRDRHLLLPCQCHPSAWAEAFCMSACHPPTAILGHPQVTAPFLIWLLQAFPVTPSSLTTLATAPSQIHCLIPPRKPLKSSLCHRFESLSLIILTYPEPSQTTALQSFCWAEDYLL